jgi:predicted Zn-dependent peptidase
MTVITETIPDLHSATVGIWIKKGSVHEPPSAGGVSHFIEHLLFKGTEKRTAEEIGKDIDSLGGQIDAFTSREYTCYYGRVLDQHLAQAIDLLMDIVFNARLREEDVEVERQVILEEIKSTEDNPEEYIHDLFVREIWKDHPLGRPICGTNESIRVIERDQIVGYYHHAYQPANILVTAAGNIKHEDLIRQLGQPLFPAGPAISDGEREPVRITGHAINKHKELEEVHICLGTRGLEQTHPNRFAGYLLNMILGSGVSSRLFQEIREKRGLAYSIYSYYDLYRDSGLLAVYGATSPVSYREVISLILKEFKSIKENGISEEELERGQQQLKISLMLGLESSMNRMNNLARNEIYFQKNITPDKIIESIEQVTKEDVIKVAQEMFQTRFLNLAILDSPQIPDFPINLLQC